METVDLLYKNRVPILEILDYLQENKEKEEIKFLLSNIKILDSLILANIEKVKFIHYLDSMFNVSDVIEILENNVDNLDYLECYSSYLCLYKSNYLTFKSTELFDSFLNKENYNIRKTFKPFKINNEKCLDIDSPLIIINSNFFEYLDSTDDVYNFNLSKIIEYRNLYKVMINDNILNKKYTDFLLNLREGIYSTPTFEEIYEKGVIKNRISFFSQGIPTIEFFELKLENQYADSLKIKDKIYRKKVINWINFELSKLEKIEEKNNCSEIKILKDIFDIIENKY